MSEGLDVEAAQRFAEWFAVHMSNFGFKWVWKEWYVLNQPFQACDVLNQVAFRLLCLFNIPNVHSCEEPWNLRSVYHTTIVS